MLKVVDLVYYCHEEFDRPSKLVEKHHPTLGYTAFTKGRMDLEVVRHLNYEGKEILDNIPYTFFKRNNAPWQIPFKTHRFIRSLNPDIIIVHGFIFPLQVIALRRSVGKHCVIVLQHHADKPANSTRKVFQKIADRHVDAYMFTASGNSQPWLEHKIIRNKNKIVEQLASSAFTEKKDKLACKQELGLHGKNNFLWVGRLNENKDPITILKAFARHILVHPGSMLFMAYQAGDLLTVVKDFISDNKSLHKNVHLLGELTKAELAIWYNAADFYISGSHEEAAGYALMEAMSVGCIPVVTSIASFKKITGNGRFAFLFQPGNVNELYGLLNVLIAIDVEQYAANIEKYFYENLGFKKIADDMVSLCEKLIIIKQ